MTKAIKELKEDFDNVIEVLNDVHNFNNIERLYTINNLITKLICIQKVLIKVI